jgi:hypothetical protein
MNPADVTLSSHQSLHSASPELSFEEQLALGGTIRGWNDLSRTDGNLAKAAVH